MGMADGRCRFVWASCGFRGNSHDSIIFQSTSLWSNITCGQTIPEVGKNIEGVNVPPLILGDSAFPFQSWPMKPYTSAGLTSSQQYFNYSLNSERMFIEEAFGESFRGNVRVHKKKSETILLHVLCYITFVSNRGRQIDGTVEPATNQRRPRNVIRRLLNIKDCHTTD